MESGGWGRVKAGLPTGQLSMVYSISIWSIKLDSQMEKVIEICMNIVMTGPPSSGAGPEDAPCVHLNFLSPELFLVYSVSRGVICQLTEGNVVLFHQQSTARQQTPVLIIINNSFHHLL